MAERSSKRGLGAGLNALFGEQEEQSGVMTLPIGKVEPRADQPRKDFDPQALSEMADSIREYGIIQPISVRKLDDGYYQIIAGERRWRAAREAGLTEVPVRVLEADDRRATEMALVENLQREDLNPIEEAQGYKTLMDEYALTQEEAAERVGKARPTVANALRLLNLSPGVLELLSKGLLSAGHARALLPLRDGELQLSAARQTVARGFSVRQTEALATHLLRGTPTPPAAAGITVDYRKEAEKTLSESLGRGVKLLGGRKKGRIALEFYSAKDRDDLIDALLCMKSGAQGHIEKD
jgi:ParB family chromosome partitioning protein